MGESLAQETTTKETGGFVHLHTHTEYSLLDGSNKINEYVNRIKELEMNSGAITDHGVMYGVIDFYKCAKAAGINPIIGCEVYVAPNSRFDRENVSGEDRYYHLVLLAETNQGYKNLMKIVSKGFVDGFYYKPRVDIELLEEFHEGIIALSACLAGEVQRNLARGFYEEGKAAAFRYQEIFGKGNFFLELQDHGIPEQQTVNQQLLRLSQDTKIELVATNDVHYTYGTDEEAHDILLCLQTGKRLSDENRMRYVGGQYYVKSKEEMESLFPYALSAIANTQKIADRCQVTIEFGVTKLPQFDVPAGLNAWEYLNQLCMKGIKERYPDTWESILVQMEYELKIIQKMGYVDYFLIVWDFIRYARSQEIMVGPGRGSAAGSIVSYVLKITNIDPLKYQLLFERFLNPERVSMPDIDIDFCYERRQEVIDYVVEKYGKDKVVQIVTFGTLAARGVIRDVGRVMDLPYTFCDTISKSIPKELNITIEKALQMNPELMKMYESDESVTKLIDMAKRLEGLPRHTSTHAAGVLITQKSVDEYVPLSKGSDGSITTQYTMNTLEELGLLKMDFLGLRTLTVIQNAVRNIKQSQNVDIDIDHLNFEDKGVLDAIGAGKTEGIFQLESAGMTNFMKELKPTSLEDLIAGISLYRPGPMDFIPIYVRGKNHPDQITYKCKELAPILAPTYGCIVYQEQVMQIVRDLGGYTLGRSDMLRRVMSKKKPSVMEKERKNFVYGNPEEGVPGCLKNGISEKIANEIFDEMTDFANYAFNKSHAAGYAVIAYQTAWLKFYYPVEYMAALISSVMDKSSKISEYILTCRRMGILVLPPNINEGEGNFSVSQGRIRYGLSAIKSIGSPVIHSIVEERNQNGEFTSMKDFVERLSSKEVNKRTIENFIKAGAFDGLGANRKQAMQSYPMMVERAAQEKKNSLSGQLSLFDLVSDETKKEYEIQLPKVEEYDNETFLALEKEVLGVYISGHPLQDYEERWRKNITAVTTDFLYDEEEKASRVEDGSRVTIGGMIVGKTIKYTKNNKVMAFLTIEDLVGTVEVIVFPRDYEKNQTFLIDDAKVFIEGRVNVEDEKDGKLICERIIRFEDAKREIWLQFPDLVSYEEKQEELFKMLADSDGEEEVVIYITDKKVIKKLPKSRTVEFNTLTANKLYNFLGESNVKVVEKSIAKGYKNI